MDKEHNSKEVQPYFVDDWHSDRADAIVKDGEIEIEITQDDDRKLTLDEVPLREFSIDIGQKYKHLYVCAANEEEAKNFVNETYKTLQPEKYADKGTPIKDCKEVGMGPAGNKTLAKAIVQAAQDGSFEMPQTMEDKLRYMSALDDTRMFHSTDVYEIYADEETAVDVERNIAKSFMEQVSEATQGYTADQPISEEKLISDEMITSYNMSLSYMTDYDYYYKIAEERNQDPDILDPDWSLGAINIDALAMVDASIPVADLPAEKRLSYLSAIEKTPDGKIEEPYLEYMHLGSVKTDEEIIPMLSKQMSENRDEIDSLTEEKEQMETKEYETGDSHINELIENRHKIDWDSWKEKTLYDMLRGDDKIRSQIISGEPKLHEEWTHADNSTFKEYHVDIGQESFSVRADSPKGAYIAARDAEIRQIIDEINEERDSGVYARGNEPTRWAVGDEKEVSVNVYQSAPSLEEERKLQTELETAIEAGKSVRPQTQGGRLKALQMIDRADMENHNPDKFQKAAREIETDLLDQISYDTQYLNRHTASLDDLDIQGIRSVDYNQDSQTIDVTTQDYGTHSIPLDAVSAEKRFSYIAAAEKVSQRIDKDDPMALLGKVKTDEEIVPALRQAIRTGDTPTNNLIHELAADSPEMMHALEDEPIERKNDGDIEI